MPPRIRIPLNSRPLAVRSKSVIVRSNVQAQWLSSTRQARLADDTSPDRKVQEHLGRKDPKPSKDEEAKGPNMDPLPHVSEEAAAMSKATGEQGPDVEQGTKVEEVAKHDKEMRQNLPKVMRDEMKEREQGKPGSRSFSTLARSHLMRPDGRRAFSTAARLRQLEQYSRERAAAAAPPPPRTQETASSKSNQPQQPTMEAPESFGDPELFLPMTIIDRARASYLQHEHPGHKYELPALPLAPGSHLKDRADPVVDQVTKMFMRDGKLAAAQRNMHTILSHLRTAAAPKPSTRYPLLPNALPAHALPLNPVHYLTLAVDSVAPLFRIRQQRGAAGGGAALQIPVPLGLRQRRRQAIVWILDAVERKGRATNGLVPFPKRFAEEVVAVVEGRSGAWERRTALHSLGVRARANLNANMLRRR